MATGMAGTRRAWVTCDGCGHARIRHLSRGRGRCAMVVVDHRPDLDGQDFATHRCDCGTFIEPNRKA